MKGRRADGNAVMDDLNPLRNPCVLPLGFVQLKEPKLQPTGIVH
jgi:hypothetical protein